MTTAITSTTDAGTASRANAASNKLAGDFDSFLKLLTTQLQYQDPLQPMDTKDFTQQLVSFTGVEQSIQTNQNLEALLATMQTQSFSNAAGFIGQQVEAQVPTAMVGETGGAEWNYTLAGQAFDTTLSIVNDRGVAIGEIKGERSAGAHVLRWDGRDASGNRAPPGLYTLQVNAKTGANGDIAATVFQRGLVEGVELANGQSKLLVGGQPIDLSKVSRMTAAQPNQAQ